jgi:ElaA protein
MKIDWTCKHYDELSLNEFHDLIHLRIAVFVIEQDCPYQELDGKDKNGYHVIGIYNGKLIACARILPPRSFYW